jgi:hypothetical protein
MSEMMSEILVIGGLIYVGFSTLTLVLIFVLLKIEDRLPEPQGGASANVSEDARGAGLCGFSEPEIARLVSYRNAVRAGYFTEDVEAPAVDAGLAAERHSG